jgi:hypothetical protein
VRADFQPCTGCGVPLDSQRFDESSIVGVPDLGDEVVLARFTLPPQYCGVLQYVSQFTDLNARRPDEAETPGLAWTLLAGGRPLLPFTNLRLILNPWGFGSFESAVRLDEGADLTFVVRRTAPDTGTSGSVTRVGGRIVGRYWYDRAFGELIGRAG